MRAEIREGESPEDAVILMGGDSRNPTWDEYVADFVEDFQPKLEAIREAVKASPWFRRTADRFCNEHYFALDDGSSVAFTWRAWGDLMQAIVGEREGYMAYYM